MASRNSKPRPETVAAKAAHYLDPATGGLVPPIQSSTTFARDTDYRLIDPQLLYGRDDQALYRIAENVLSELEGAAAAIVLPSGMAAVAALFRTLPNGAAVAIQGDIYYGTTVWLRRFCQRRGIALHEFDGGDAESVERVITGAQPEIVWIETPSNPWLAVVDIGRVAEVAHSAGARLVVDSTAATPILTRPHEFGADYVMHAATKALNGHSDVLAGIITTAREDERWAEMKSDRREAGTLLGPFEAWLLIRGMRTLALRVRTTSANAQAIAEFLDGHDRVQAVHYPGLENHPAHALAARQMEGGFGYLLSFEVAGSRANTLSLANALRTILRATSLGGIESVIEHRHTIEGDYSDIPENLLRLSVGIEHVDDLIADLDQALGSRG